MTRLPLITGATGFAGGHLLAYLSSRGIRAHAWGHRAKPAPGDGAATWTAVDLLDRRAVRAALDASRPSAIYHCAGVADVHGTWSAPAHALRVNAVGTHYLLEAARDLELGVRVLVTGSALVYRQSLEPITEDHPIGPATPYGVSKLAQEMTASESAIDTLLARPFNHAGPGQSPAYATSAFAQQIAEIEAGRRDAVLRVGNLDAKRDITDVRDTVRAYQLVMEHGVPGRPYNVSSGEASSIRDLLDRLIARAAVSVTVRVDPAKYQPNDLPLLVGDPTRIRSELGWRPSIPLDETLGAVLDYWRAEMP